MRQMMLHALKCNKWLYLCFWLLLIPVWVPALDSRNVHAVIRVPLYITFFGVFFMVLAPVFGPASPRSSKMLSVVPLSLRRRGLATWGIAVGVPVIVSVLGMLAATGLLAMGSRRNTVDGRWLAFLTACEFTYAGTLCFLWTTNAGATKGIVRQVLVTGFIVATLTGWAVVAQFLPTTWDQVHVWAWLALINGLILTLAGYFRLNRLALYGARSGVGRVSERADSVSPDRAPFHHRLSGVAYLLWTDIWRAGAGIIIALVALAGAASVLAGRLSFVESVNLIIGSSGLLPRIGAPLIFLALLGTGRLTSGRQIALRHLRILPLATWELNLMMIAGPSAFWLAVWLVRSAAGLLLLAQPPTLAGVDLLVGLAGLTCLGDSATLRWKDRGLYSVLTFLGTVPLVLILIGGRFNPTPIELPRTVLGLCCMGAAALWNHHTLTRCSAIYKRREAHFRLVAR